MHIPTAPQSWPVHNVIFSPNRFTIRPVRPPEIAAVQMPTTISEMPIINWFQLKR